MTLPGRDDRHGPAPTTDWEYGPAVDGIVLEADFSPDDHIVVTIRLPASTRIGRYITVVPQVATP